MKICNTVWQRLDKTILKNIMTVFTGTLLAQLIAFLTAPIVARLFAPEQYGIATLISTLAGTCSVFVCLRYSQAIILPKDDSEAAGVVSVSLVSCVVITLCIGVLLMLCGKSIISLFNVPGAVSYLWFLPILVFCQGISQCAVSWSNRKKLFKRYSLSRIVEQTTKAGVKIGTGSCLGGSALYLIIGNLVGTIVGLCTLITGILKRKTIGFMPKNDLIRIARKYSDFPRYSAPTGLLNNLGQSLPVYILGGYFEPQIIGFYAMANALLRLPVGMVSDSVRRVILQKMAEIKAEGGSISALYIRSTVGLICVGAVPFLCFGLWGKHIVWFFLGENWKEAGIYAEMLCPWLFFMFINPPTMCVYVVERKQRVLFHLQNIGTAGRMGALFVGCIVFKTAEQAIGLFVVASVVLNIVFIGYVVVFFGRKRIIK